METKKVTIEIPAGKKAERKEVDKPVTERIKTFEDAKSELGSAHPLVEEYETITCRCGGLSNDTLAYMRLRIIAAALNEGWEPQFTTDEYRHYPLLTLCPEEDIEENSEEWEEEQFKYMRNGASCGLACAFSSFAWSRSNSNRSARLAVKSDELAEYFGKQFIDIWADYVLINHGNDEK